MPQNEPSRAKEEVIFLLGKDGEDMPKPEDTRCQAKVGKGRCKQGITFDEKADHWSVFCADHNKENKKARSEGGERVERVS